MSKFKVKEIRPNPFRNMERYPIDREKIEKLRASFKKTGFWGNVVCRLVDGKPEIAYGHHRWIAMKEERLGEVDLIVRKLSDDDMLHIMADENMQEWDTSALIDQETVRAVVEAYGAGKIELSAPDEKTPKNQLRYAPSFVQGYVMRARASHAYTAEALAEYLDWRRPSGQPSERLLTALSALEMIEMGILKEQQLAKMGITEARSLVDAVRPSLNQRRAQVREKEKEVEKALRDAEKAKDAEDRAEAKERAKTAEKEIKEIKKEAHTVASEIGEGISRGFKNKELLPRDARREAAKIDTTSKRLPNLEQVVDRISEQLAEILSDNDARKDRLAILIEYKDQIAAGKVRNVRRQIENLIKRLIRTYCRLGGSISDIENLIS